MSASRRQMARPRPAPPYSRAGELSACRKSSNTRSWSSGLIPMPVSATAMATSCGAGRPRHPLQEQARVAQDRVEGGAELVGHVGQELRFGRGSLLELDGLAAQQLVLAHQLGRGLAHALLEEAGGLLQLLVEPRAL